ncbi:threonine dehydratase 1 biosynthetic, chloroplastic-like [Benincasa hispida]|uniref:threonine dehydratase 1 biosynthetic, chloroplastic-like n=1 Tax=Benincasa hispida TaxID=102211 RepID=UPI0018FF53F1|nr:threonine dehydratase 1 biosynthetic, chloroplastic-like [Benincasa hispida]
MASHWQRQHPRQRPEHGHGQFPNPWERHPRDHGPVHEDNYNTNYTVVSWEELQYPSGELGAIPKRPEVIDDRKQMEYLTRILGSKVYDVTSESPFHFAPILSYGLGVNLWLKREDSHSGYSFMLRGAYNMISHLPNEELDKGVQKDVEKEYSFNIRGAYNMMANLPKEALMEKKMPKEEAEKGYSFKTRGAYNMMANLPKEELDKGVIFASTGGDHAQGLALAANKLGTETVIVMPTTTPPIKVEMVKNLGGKIVLYGDTFDDALKHAKQLSQEKNLTVIPPFDHKDVIIGQGTVGMEIARQMRDPLHAIFVSVESGELLAGVASFYKLVFPDVKIIGVEARDANRMALALHKNEIVKVDDIGMFADNVGVQQVGNESFRIARELVDGIVLVDKDDISIAIKEMYEDTGSMLEPSGVVSIAGAKAYCKYNNMKGVNVVAITNGSNINFNQLGSIVHIVDAADQTEAKSVIGMYLDSYTRGFGASI